MEERQICQWCMTEIVWDEEIGPESHCPHCDNELGGYRSMQIGLDNDEHSSSVGLHNAKAGSDEEEDSFEASDDDLWDDAGEGYRGGNTGMLAAENVIQRIVDGQAEAPECPVCREYMLEMGVQTVGGQGFQPTAPQATGQLLMPEPFNVIWYVCPACFHTSSLLSAADREALMERLAAEERE